MRMKKPFASYFLSCAFIILSVAMVFAGSDLKTIERPAVPGKERKFTVDNPANVSMKVPVSLNSLCEIVNCNVSSDTPTITNVAGLLKPGGILIIWGEGFGKGMGRVRMYGDFPGGSIDLVALEWTDLGIGIEVPPEISGVKDQMVNLVVETKDHKTSNRWPKQFDAERDLILLPPSGVSVNCSTNSSYDDCAPQSDQVFFDFTFKGYHRTTCCYDSTFNFWRSDTGIDNGTDTISSALINGWVFYDLDWQYITGNDCSSVAKTNFVPNRDRMNITCDWHTSQRCGNDSAWVDYAAKVYISGPKGVPYQ